MSVSIKLSMMMNTSALFCCLHIVLYVPEKSCFNRLNSIDRVCYVDYICQNMMLSSVFLLMQFLRTCVQALPVSIKQLVESSPHHTDDGAVILSTVTNTAFLLNKDTGALIRKFENTGRELEKAASLATGTGKPEDSDALLESTSDSNSDSGKIIPRLLCLRTDYTVTVQEIATGRVKWNVSLGEVKTFPLLEPGCSGQSSIADDSRSKSLVASYPPGTKIKVPTPSYEVAQIGIFSSGGEYIGKIFNRSTLLQLACNWSLCQTGELTT